MTHIINTIKFPHAVIMYDSPDRYRDGINAAIAVVKIERCFNTQVDKEVLDRIIRLLELL